jgi:hypothetical protein
MGNVCSVLVGCLCRRIESFIKISGVLCPFNVLYTLLRWRLTLLVFIVAYNNLFCSDHLLQVGSRVDESGMALIRLLQVQTLETCHWIRMRCSDLIRRDKKSVPLLRYCLFADVFQKLFIMVPNIIINFLFPFSKFLNNFENLI